MDGSNLVTTKKYFRVDRMQICFLKSVFEACDGIALLRTVDPVSGVVVFHISPGCEPDVEMILNDLQKDILIEPFIGSD